MNSVEILALPAAFSICFSHRKGGTPTMYRQMPAISLLRMISLLCFGKPSCESCQCVFRYYKHKPKKINPIPSRVPRSAKESRRLILFLFQKAQSDTWKKTHHMTPA